MMEKHLSDPESYVGIDTKLSNTPLTTNGSSKPKRKRHDPKPIWAVLEHEYVKEEPRQEEVRNIKAERPTPQPDVGYQRPMNNGGHVVKTFELQGFERPITDNKRVYDEISRKVCDLFWFNVIDKPEVMQVIQESKGNKLEVEAKWGQIIDPQTGRRFCGYHASECVLNQTVAQRFESTMSLKQHQTLNQFLNNQVRESANPAAQRPEIKYVHLKEVDSFYEVDQEALSYFPPLAQQMIKSQSRQRIRVTRNQKTNAVVAKIIKLRVENMAISSPMTEWDYRISINLEIDYPGPIDILTPSTEQGKTPESMARNKDRMSYRWLNGVYAIDLTQVITGEDKHRNHELELELDPERLLRAAQIIQEGAPQDEFEHIVTGMMNNLRVLSRELTGARGN